MLRSDALERALDAKLLAGGALVYQGHGIADGAERIAQLVADRGGDPADRGEALGVGQLFHRRLQVGIRLAQVDFHLLALGDVRDHAADIALAVEAS